MSTGIQKDIIDVGSIEITNNTVCTTRKFLKTNVEKDCNVEPSVDDDDIERESNDIESESESDGYESDSELSTTNDIFVFESYQLDSDDELKNIIEQNYIYHDNVKKIDEFPNANISI